MALFFAPNIHHSNSLPEEESQHAIKVLRLHAGDEIEIVDGKGGFYKAVITHAHAKHCGFEIVETITQAGKRRCKLHIAIAPTKNIERLEWFIEKVTEIGIDEITPIICRYSERKIIKAERLEKILVSAAKQSVKAYFPILHPLCTFDEFMLKCNAADKFIAHCYPQEKILLSNVCANKQDIIILIGPEGDFCETEVQKAIANDFVPISLGESRLRTETAGVVACTTVSILT